MILILNKKLQICSVEPDDSKFKDLYEQKDKNGLVVNQDCLKTLKDNDLISIYNNCYPKFQIEVIKSKRLLLKALNRWIFNNMKVLIKKEKSNGRENYKPKSKM